MIKPTPGDYETLCTVEILHFICIYLEWIPSLCGVIRHVQHVGRLQTSVGFFGIRSAIGEPYHNYDTFPTAVWRLVMTTWH